MKKMNNETKDTMINIMLFILFYLIICPTLFLFVEYLFESEINGLTLAKVIGQGLGLVIGRILVWAVPTAWNRIRLEILWKHFFVKRNKRHNIKKGE